MARKQNTKASQSTVSFAVSDNASMEWNVQPVSLATTMAFSQSATAFDNQVIALAFAGQALPSWKGFIATIKAENEGKAKGEKLPVPTRQSHGALYQRFNLIEKIQLAMENGFKPLAYWNSHAETKKRVTMPNLSQLMKGARLHLGTSKEPESPSDIASKRLISAWKAIQECKGKDWQSASKKLEAILASLNIPLPEQETETDEQS